MTRIVLDTNVLVSTLRSKQGASHKILKLIGSDKFKLVISVPLVFEYEELLLLKSPELNLSASDIEGLIDYICLESDRFPIHFLWRPILPDPEDDMVLEVAVVGNCKFIVTFNISDYEGAERFGIKAITPKELLAHIGEIV